jgi:hypothetical protein
MPAPVSRTIRWVPRWPGYILLPVWLVLFGLAVEVSLQRPGRAMRDLFIPIPPFLVLGCGVMALFNRTKVRLAREGIVVTHGPLPLTIPPVTVPSAAVHSTYSRKVARHFRSGGEYFAAGVRTADGRHVDVLAPLADSARAARAAMELALYVSSGTNRRIECVELGATMFDSDLLPLRRATLWLALFTVSIVVAVVLELTR